MKFTNPILLAATAAVGMAVAGAACSGGPDGSAEATQAQEARSQIPNAEAPSTRETAGELATAEFRVEGMTCGGCAIATEMAVKKLDGVESADAEYDEATGEGRCSVTYDPSVVSTDQIGGAIEEAGFTPGLVHGPSGS